MADLSEKKCLVTGGARGIGEAIARKFAAEGANVLVADINTAAGERVAHEIGGGFVRLDVSSETEWREVVDEIAAQWHRIDVLVNNAGVGDLGRGATAETTQLEDWKRYFSINMDGTFLGCRTCLPTMKAHGGSIINMSSIAALVPVPFHVGYAASKAAVYHFTQSLALHCAEQGYRIRCNTIHPGQVRTEMLNSILRDMSESEQVPEDDIEQLMLSKIPLGEWGTEDDIAEAALFLASDRSRYMTGDRLVIDGGIVLAN